MSYISLFFIVCALSFIGYLFMPFVFLILFLFPLLSVFCLSLSLCSFSSLLIPSLHLFPVLCNAYLLITLPLLSYLLQYFHPIYSYHFYLYFFHSLYPLYYFLYFLLILFIFPLFYISSQFIL